MKGWIGVDLDGTLASYDGWKGPGFVGEPVPFMLRRVQEWLKAGKDVRIFTARVANPDGSKEREAEILANQIAIDAWCEQHLGRRLPITCMKDFAMTELWDDRAVSVELNTGRAVSAMPPGDSWSMHIRSQIGVSR